MFFLKHYPISFADNIGTTKSFGILKGKQTKCRICPH